MKAWRAWHATLGEGGGRRKGPGVWQAWLTFAAAAFPPSLGCLWAENIVTEKREMGSDQLVAGVSGSEASVAFPWTA